MSASEAAIIQVFLKAVGAKVTNTSLIAAVAAWARESSGPDLTRKGMLAAARKLLAAGDDYHGYGAVIVALRAGNVSNFLNTLAMSAWDAKHYGVTIIAGFPYGTNSLIKLYNEYTGVQLPQAKPKPGEKQRPVAVPASPPILRAPRIKYWPSGYTPHRFYLERHPQAIEPDGTLRT